MLLSLLIGLIVVLSALVLFWYVQTRNVETVPYQVLKSDGDIEIRAYPAVIVAEVARTGSRDQAVRSGFGPLARYIFAKERRGEKIAMTAPVTQKEDGDTWTVQFIMPSGYNMTSLPRPVGSDVHLRELLPVRRVAIRFSGWWSDALFRAKDARLRQWMGGRGLNPTGTPTFAYYNDPFTPGFLRRNEILYDLAP